MKLSQLYIFILISLFSTLTFADGKKGDAKTQLVESEETNVEYNKVMNEYKQYIDTVPLEIRKELEEYRIKIAEMNKAKKDLYKTLSQEAQAYMKTEQKFKKRLPMKLSKIVEQESKKDKK